MQAPRVWYSRIDIHLISLGFNKSNADCNFYYKVVDGYPMILVLYVDGMFLTQEERLIVRCMRELSLESR